MWQYSWTELDFRNSSHSINIIIIIISCYDVLFTLLNLYSTVSLGTVQHDSRCCLGSWLGRWAPTLQLLARLKLSADCWWGSGSEFWFFCCYTNRRKLLPPSAPASTLDIHSRLCVKNVAGAKRLVPARDALTENATVIVEWKSLLQWRREELEHLPTMCSQSTDTETIKMHNMMELTCVL